MTDRPKPLLSLDTLVARDTILIRSKLHPDGKHYELRQPDELGIEHHQRAQHYAAQVQQLDEDNLTAEQATLLSHALNEILGMALIGLEDEVRDALTDAQKGAIAQAFYTKVQDNVEQQADPDGDPTTGES